jgi:hypothetical protein
MNKQGYVDIRGKSYKTVALRVQEFREWFPEHSLSTEIVKLDDDQCLIRATISKLVPVGDDVLVVDVATGHAHEWRKSSQINGTSYVENCETSAIGRALSALGIGGQEFASAEEVANAIHQQNASKTNADTPRTVQPPSQPITPIAGAFEALGADEQQFLREQSGEVIAYVADGNFDKAQEITDSLDNDEKLALWSLLDSKTRSALKKHKEAMKVAA